MDNLLIVLDAKSKAHLYEQIYDFIRKEIREGKLHFGERLPSTRLLAQQLGISRATVELAYEQLSSEGYIQAEAYRGFFVCDVSQLQDFSVCADEGRMGKRQGKKSAAIQKKSVRYDFSPNAIDMSLFPVETWKRIHKRVLLDYQDTLLRLGNPRGDIALRETICHYLHASRGVNCEPEQIIIGAGNDYLLLLLQKILGQDRTVAMEEHTYMRAYRIFQSGGYRMQTVGMDESGMSVDELAQSCADLAYVMPSHQFPCGVTMPIRRRMELLTWAEGGQERYVIEDDYDSEFRYRGKPVPALQSLDRSGRVIHIGTFSKSLTPAIRISYLVLPQQLVARYEQNAGFLASTVSRIDQAVLQAFVADGHFERHLNKSRKVYRQKHDVLMDALTPLRERFNISGDAAGLHVILRPNQETGIKKAAEAELLAGAEKEGCKVYGMSAYAAGERLSEETEETALLLGYASLSAEQIRAGVKALTRAWL